MQHITVGRRKNASKVAFVECVKDRSLNNIDIKGKCFLLIILTKGKLELSVCETIITAAAPAFLCFDETEKPFLVSKTKARVIPISESQLEFTSVPIKDIANMTGFKTVQHFGRIFKEQTVRTPAEFRKTDVEKQNILHCSGAVCFFKILYIP